MKRRSYILCSWLMLAAIILASAPFRSSKSRAQSAQIQLVSDVAMQNQDGLLGLYGSIHNGGSLGMPVAAGDLNGDGRADVFFTEMYANSSPDGQRINNGQLNIYLSDGRDTGALDVASNPSMFFSVRGQRSGDLLGASVASGDVNGDGLTDILVTATGNDGPDGTRAEAGAAYIIPGSKTFNSNIDLQTVDGQPPAGVTAIYGSQAGCRLGIWADVGDVDGDGIPDILLGADQLNTPGGFHAGGAFIIFGSHSLPSVIDLASPPPGVRITTILGVTAFDHWGACIHAADLNGDGIDDVVISAALDRESAAYVNPQDQTSGEDLNAAGDNGARPMCGEVYVLFGSSSWPTQIDLRTPPATATHLIGANSLDFFGSQTFHADLNGDGKQDLIIGAIQAQSPDQVSSHSSSGLVPKDYSPPGVGNRTGAVYVIYGGVGNLQGATIDMKDPSTTGFQISVIYGEENQDCAGDSVRAYDINNDGMAELFIGSPQNSITVNGQLREEAGDTKVIVGQSSFLPPVIKMYDPPATPVIYRLAGAHGVEQGLDGGDEFSYRLTGADVDGDGYTDYVVNAMHGDGLLGSIVNAGQVYVFSGKKLSEKIGIPLGSKAPSLTSASLSLNGSIVSQTAAGQSGLTVTVNGTGFQADTVFTINGTNVTYHAAGSAGTQVTINLDENLTVRNSVGQLTVQAQNTSPASPLSNTVTAGTLTGPQISGATVKLKPSGVKVVLTISGQGFSNGSSVVVTNSQGQPVRNKAVNFVSSSSLTTKLIGQTFTSGMTFNIQVVTSSGVKSNQATATLP